MLNVRKEGPLYFYEMPRGFTAGFTSSEVSGLDEAIMLFGRTAYMEQEHGAAVKPEAESGTQVADGIFSSQKNLSLLVKTADCLPLLLWSEEQSIIGAIHMGWRSAGAGILQQIPYDLSGFSVIAGPGMRKCCYEVGTEVAESPGLHGATEQREGKLFFDPISFATEQFLALGVSEDRIYDLDLCSVCGDLDLPSFRKDRTTKRTLSFISKEKG